MTMKKNIFIAINLLILVFSLSAKDIDMTGVEVESYDNVNFPPFLLDMRRSEIVTFGSYPFTMMTVSAGYSLFKYFSNGMDSKYTPNPFMKASSANLTDAETKGIILGAAGLSIGIGIIDFFLNQIAIASEKQEKEARLGENGLDPDITIIPVYKTKSETDTTQKE